ncbi:MAG: glutamate formimidoyltransferase [Chloroflexota bacterium]
MSLVECIPNFSEGRDSAVIQAIADAIASAGVHLLDVSSDADHNRTVITFAGEPDVVAEGAFRGVRAAAERINLAVHSGVHPRIGAADVVPFVPLRGVSMQVCAELAQATGARIAADLNLPVFLYEAAAKQPGRTNLANIRRGGYERLQARMQSDPAMQPDYGPATLGPAGAVVVGAREPLVAYNAYLDTDDVSIAKAIAKAVRASSGGLPFLKAIGLLVDGRAQVSMNVIDFRQISLHTVTEAVRAEATKHGTTVTRTELIGLVPQQALIDAAIESLALPANVRDLILEQRVGAATGNFQTIPFE